LISEESFSLLDLLFENVEVLQVGLDVFKRKIDQHTSDLRCEFFSGNLLNEFIDDFSNLGFVVGVGIGHSWNHSHGLLHVLELDWYLTWSGSSGTGWHTAETSRWHTSKGWHGIHWWHSWHGWSLLWHHWWLAWSSHWWSLTHLRSWGLSWSTWEGTWGTGWSGVWSSLLSLVVEDVVELWLDELEQVVEESENFWFVEEIHGVSR